MRDREAVNGLEFFFFLPRQQQIRGADAHRVLFALGQRHGVPLGIPAYTQAYRAAGGLLGLRGLRALLPSLVGQRIGARLRGEAAEGNR